jgi:hypothetical protein
MAKTPAEMVEAVLRNLPKNTGRTAAQWAEILERDGPATDRYRWLRETHGLGHVAAKALSGGMSAYAEPDRLVDAQYAAERASLRPIYEALVKAAKRLGPDVAAKPCKTYVPLHRTKTFAVIKAERGRVDLGLCLDPATKAAGRLLGARRLGSDRVTHKLELRSPNEVDGEVVRWMKAAYSACG